MENGKPISVRVLKPTSNNSFEIQEAAPTDLSAILQVFEAAIRISCQKDYSPDQIEAWVAGIQNISRWEKAIQEQHFLVAEAENKIVGFASLEKGSYLDFMFVHPDYLGQGIARQLYQALENEALKQGSKLIYSNVSITARPFFEKQGFKVVTKNHNKLRGTELINYRMEKGL